MRPPERETPPAADRERPQESLGSDEDSIPRPGICVRGDCRGQGCPTPCATPDALARLATATERIAEALEAAVVADGNGTEWWQIVVTS